MWVELSTKRREAEGRPLRYTSMALIWNQIFPVSRPDTLLVHIIKEGGGRGRVFFQQAYFCIFGEQCLLRKFSE